MGLKTKVPAKPEALKAMEQIEALGIPFVAGGLADQPHIWMMEYKIAHDQTATWKAILAREERESADASSNPRF